MHRLTDDSLSDDQAAAICEGKGDNKTRKQFLLDGEKYADKALEINPECGDG